MPTVRIHAFSSSFMILGQYAFCCRSSLITFPYYRRKSPREQMMKSLLRRKLTEHRSERHWMIQAAPRRNQRKILNLNRFKMIPMHQLCTNPYSRRLKKQRVNLKPIGLHLTLFTSVRCTRPTLCTYISLLFILFQHL